MAKVVNDGDGDVLENVVRLRSADHRSNVRAKRPVESAKQRLQCSGVAVLGASDEDGFADFWHLMDIETHHGGTCSKHPEIFLVLPSVGRWKSRQSAGQESRGQATTQEPAAAAVLGGRPVRAAWSFRLGRRSRSASATTVCSAQASPVRVAGRRASICSAASLAPPKTCSQSPQRTRLLKIEPVTFLSSRAKNILWAIRAGDPSGSLGLSAQPSASNPPESGDAAPRASEGLRANAHNPPR